MTDPASDTTAKDTTEKPAPSLEEEKRIVADLQAAFPALEGKALIQRARRIWLEVPLEQFRTVFAYAKQKLDFVMLCTITGTDEGTDIGLIYHLARESGVMLNLTLRAPKDAPGPNTVIEFFPHAELYEREVVDLFGAQVQGLPEGSRYPLPEDWPDGEYPLRKEWKGPGSPAESGSTAGKDSGASV